MSRLIDISLTVSERLVRWPGSPSVRFERRLDLDKGDVATDTSVYLNLHTGTHVDAPAHFIAGGKTVEQLDPELFVGPAFVACLPAEVKAIGAESLEKLSIPTKTERLMLHTGNSRLWEQGHQEFVTDFAALTADGAAWVAKRGIQLIGIDYLSIQRYHDGPETHRILLEAGIVILEGLNLSAVTIPGRYELICLPVKFEGVEGAPARAVLRGPLP